MTEFYSCRALLEPGVPVRDYRITKFDEDWNVLSSYETSTHGCECPQGHKASCRHREMLVMFQSAGHIDDGWLLDWHTRLWWEPSGDATNILNERSDFLPATAPATATLPTAPTLPPVTNPVQPESDSVARPPEVAAPIPAPSGAGFKRRFG
jgi:hypothetical protein